MRDNPQLCEVAWDDIEHLMDFNRSGRIILGQGIDNGPSFSLARTFGKSKYVIS